MRARPNSGLEKVIADLDRLGVPPNAPILTAQAALRADGCGVAGERLRAAVKARRQRVAVPALIAALVDGRLAGAACVGRHELFDAELDTARETATQRDTRHAAAVAICTGCPVRDTCRNVADETGQRARGVWAGSVRNVSRPAGRPRKESAA
ncbi:WhiB family transcriptional regulator [Rhodococcus pyridinivorans]|uniref:WhiB family transcriptional regulator n=1 Tax=Rhodococcus pyridinivorans TaxID=103816 RepID=UPI001586A17C|nr:WhiB family transcriptional regulator [Rhodococcus pyridinivorans]